MGLVARRHPPIAISNQIHLVLRLARNFVSVRSLGASQDSSQIWTATCSVLPVRKCHCMLVGFSAPCMV